MGGGRGLSDSIYVLQQLARNISSVSSFTEQSGSPGPFFNPIPKILFKLVVFTGHIQKPGLIRDHPQAKRDTGFFTFKWYNVNKRTFLS